MKIIIDNGHGIETAGKCSPDMSLHEYKWTRDIAQRLSRALTLSGIDTVLLVPEIQDTPLRERVRRVNAWCSKLGAANCLLVSLHINAAPGARWSSPSGFCPFVAPNASHDSKRFARLLYQEAVSAGLKGNRCVPPQQYWVGDFAIIRDTKCPAVLSENLFMTNKDEVSYLLSEQGRQTIVDIHANAIKRYLDSETI